MSAIVIANEDTIKEIMRGGSDSPAARSVLAAARTILSDAPRSIETRKDEAAVVSAAEIVKRTAVAIEKAAAGEKRRIMGEARKMAAMVDDAALQVASELRAVSDEARKPVDELRGRRKELVEQAKRMASEAAMRYANGESADVFEADLDVVRSIVAEVSGISKDIDEIVENAISTAKELRAKRELEEKLAEAERKAAEAERRAAEAEKKAAAEKKEAAEGAGRGEEPSASMAATDDGGAGDCGAAAKYKSTVDFISESIVSAAGVDYRCAKKVANAIIDGEVPGVVFDGVNG